MSKGESSMGQLSNHALLKGKPALEMQRINREMNDLNINSESFIKKIGPEYGTQNGRIEFQNKGNLGWEHSNVHLDEPSPDLHQQQNYIQHRTWIQEFSPQTSSIANMSPSNFIPGPLMPISQFKNIQSSQIMSFNSCIINIFIASLLLHSYRY